MADLNGSLHALSESEWEDLCDGCAKCCDIGNGVACPKLGNDRRCTVYKSRFETEICVKVTPDNVQWLHAKGILPDTCAYVRHMAGKPLVQKEYPLVPFLTAHPTIQARYMDRRQRWLSGRRTAGET